MKIQFFDALAGAGKTRALAHYAHKLARAGEKVLFVQPSKLLIDKTLSDEILPLEPRYRVRAIHGGVSSDVVRSIVEHFTSAAEGAGEVLLITHEAFMRLPFIQNRKQWSLIFDEAPSADLFEALNVPETHFLITDHLELADQDAAYGKITWRQGSRTHLQRMARNVRADQVWSQFSGLLGRIVSPHWDVYALQSNYHSVLKDDGHARQLMTYSLLRPSIFDGFKATIIAAALFQDTCLYRLWSAEGVVFEPVGRGMQEALRYQQHSNGQLITIRYVTDAAWSKTLRDRKNGGGKEGCIRDQLPAMIGKAMEEKCFAWMGNKDLPDDYFCTDRAYRLPNSPHGLNGYQHLHDVVVLSALNAPPAHFHFMETRGLDAEALRCAHYRTAVYQAVMRISIRNPLDAHSKSITVMDRSTALWLQDLFPGSNVEALGGEPLKIVQRRAGRPRHHATAAERVKACRERKRVALATIAAVNSDSLIYGTAFASIYDASSGLGLDLMDDDSFIQLLKDLHSRVIPSKHENLLFSPSSFDPERPGATTKRGKDNVRHARGIWLDNDGGDLTHAEFARLFPKLRMVIWNTYSSTKANPRWRCFIPMTAAVDGEVYRGLVRQIEQTLWQAGYASAQEIASHPKTRLKRHGFDIGKFGASSLFYAPCQAVNASDSFFVDYDDADRAPLDPQRWIENDDSPMDTIAHFEPCEPPTTNGASEELVTAAVSQWRQTPKGHGHSAFFRLAIDLKKAGLGAVEIEQQLFSEAQFAHSPRERRAEVAGLIKGLWLSGSRY